jgi:cytochrome c-type biogenesis protein CcmH
VFIFARAESGPPMPLAILRRQVRDLPMEFRLDDSMAMSPQMRLSRYPRVLVSARVSKSGGAMPTSGDLQSAITPLALGGSADLVIDRVLP